MSWRHSVVKTFLLHNGSHKTICTTPYTMTRRILNPKLAAVLVTMMLLAMRTSLAFRTGGSFRAARRVASSKHFLASTIAAESSLDDNDTNNNMLLDPISIKNDVFRKDQRPVILFDGGR